MIVFVSAMLMACIILAIAVAIVLILQRFFRSPQSYRKRHQRIRIFCALVFIALIGPFTIA